jgi:mycobactin salicyl-AMP ligase
MTWRAIGEDLRETAAARPDHVAVIRDDRSLTFAELERRAEAAAAGLHGLGVGRGAPHAPQTGLASRSV